MKHHPSLETSRGFVTMVELKITAVILAILVGVGLPSYTTYLRRDNRADAVRALLADAEVLQHCYSAKSGYLAKGCPVKSGTILSPDHYYLILVSIPSAKQYTLTATAILAPQTGDRRCRQFQLLSSGQQLATPAANAPMCWSSL